MRVALLFSPAALILGCIAVPAAAQISPALDPGVMVGWAAGEAVQYDNERRAREARQRADVPRLSLSKALGSAAPKVSAASIRSLSYRPSQEVRRTNFAQFVARTRKVDPEGAARLENMLANEQPMERIQGYLDGYGMSTSNVADAIAVYLVSAWQATRADDSDPDRGTLLAVRDQVASAIGSTPQFRSATDAQKQELAESNLLQAIIASQMATAAIKQPELRGAIAQAVAKGAQSSYGIDVRSLDLTPQGFRNARSGEVAPDAGGTTDLPEEVAMRPAGEAGAEQPTTLAATEESNLPGAAALLSAAGLGGFGVWALRRRAG